MPTCKTCQKEFKSKSALKMHYENKHLTKGQVQNKKNKNKRIKKIISIIAMIGIFFAFISVGIYFFSNLEPSYTKGEVHWHAELFLEVCGENIALPSTTYSSQKAHGKSFVGNQLMHLHDSPEVHIEGTVISSDQITLAALMSSLDLIYTKNQLLSYQNGDLCPDGSIGNVSLLVNGIQSNEGPSKVIVDGDKYKIIFE